MSHGEDAAERLEQLLDAIDLIKADRRDEALPILRGLIRHDSNHEAAWLWMSVAVESVDQSILCLDNVLRINPHNTIAAGALYRLRRDEMASEKRRAQLRNYRDLAVALSWLLIMASLCAISLDVMTVNWVTERIAG